MRSTLTLAFEYGFTVRSIQRGIHTAILKGLVWSAVSMPLGEREAGIADWIRGQKHRVFRASIWGHATTTWVHITPTEGTHYPGKSAANPAV